MDSPRTSVRPRARRLGVLAAVVLAIHMWLLSGMPLPQVGRPEPGSAKPQMHVRLAQAPATSAPTPAPGVRSPPPKPAGEAIRKDIAPAAPVQALASPPGEAVSNEAAVPRQAVVPATAAAVVIEPDAAARADMSNAAIATATATATATADPAVVVAQAAAGTAAAPAKAGERPASAARRAVLPPPMVLRYQVVARSHGLEVTGRGELAWQHDGRQYELRMDSGGFPLPQRSQRSTGAITPEGLAPLRFSDRRRSEEAVHFDRERGRFVFSTNQPPAEIEPGAQDRLSVLMQLAAWVGASGGRVPAGTEYALQVAGTKEAQEWVFRAEGEETLRLPAGEVRALRLVRLPRREHDIKVELWIAPGRDYAPVRLRLTQPNGDSLDQQWSGTDKR